LFREGDTTIFTESEVDYVIEMLKGNFKEFKSAELIRPFLLKSQHTLVALYAEQSLQTHCSKLLAKYKEASIESTLKLLIRCKMQFHARGLLVRVCLGIGVYEGVAKEVKGVVDAKEDYRVQGGEMGELKEVV